MQKMKDGISVIIPAYNAQKTISKTLDALKNQDFGGDYEVLVINDASDDDTSKIVHGYVQDGSIFHLIELPRRSGPGTARDVGIKQARFDIIAFSDADCIPSSQRLGVIAEAITIQGRMLISGSTTSDDVVIYPWKNAPANQLGITANMACMRQCIGDFRFGEEFVGMCGEDTNFVLQLEKKGIPLYYLESMRVLHPVNILPFKRLLMRSKARENEVLLYKKYGKQVMSSFHFLFRPLIAGRISLFSIGFISGIVLALMLGILLSWGLVLGLCFLGYFAFLVYAYRFLVTYSPTPTYSISWQDRNKTFWYFLCTGILFVYYRITGSIKFGFFML